MENPCHKGKRNCCMMAALCHPCTLATKLYLSLFTRLGPLQIPSLRVWISRYIAERCCLYVRNGRSVTRHLLAQELVLTLNTDLQLHFQPEDEICLPDFVSNGSSCCYLISAVHAFCASEVFISHLGQAQPHSKSAANFWLTRMLQWRQAFVQRWLGKQQDTVAKPYSLRGPGTRSTVISDLEKLRGEPAYVT